MDSHFKPTYFFVFILVMLLTGFFVQPANSKSQVIEGTPGKEQLRAVEDMSMVEARQELQEAATPLSILPFMSVPEGANIVQGPSSASTTSESQSILSVDSPPIASSFIALEDNNSIIPPDTHGSVGLNHLMVTLNSQVRIQNRSGGVLSTVTLNSFWGSVNSGNGAFDPKVLYDLYNNRWITVACDDSWSTTSGLLIGVTDSNDPTGTWYKFRIAAADANWIDYPSIGFNKNWIVVTVNIFNSSGNYVRSEVYAFNKTIIYSGASAPYTRFTHTSGVYAPAVTYETSIDTEYLISTYNSTSGIVRLATITGPVGSESFTMHSTNLYSTLGGWSQYPLGNSDFAPQLGSSQKIMTNDSRMQNLVYRNGSLWATHTIFLPSGGNPTRSAVQWWQISTSPSVIQNGRIDDSSGATFYAFPSIAVNVNNDVLIGFARFSALQYASGNYVFRASSDPTNTMRVDVVLKAGEAKYYKTYSGTTNRWGDYSHTTVDPVNDVDFWTIQEYAWTPGGGYDRWSTWWGRIVPPPLTFNKTSPNDGAVVLTSYTTLQWDTSSGATSYEYCIDITNNSTCDSSWVDVGTNNSIVINGLSQDSIYYWQVRANNPGGTTYADGSETSFWSFTTGSDPGTFSKTSPFDAATGQSTTPILTWGASSGAAEYEYCYDTTNDDDCSTWDSNGTSTSKALSGLSQNTTYYWQVRALNDFGTTYADGSETFFWSFTTGSELLKIFLPIIMSQ